MQTTRTFAFIRLCFFLSALLCSIALFLPQTHAQEDAGIITDESTTIRPTPVIISNVLVTGFNESELAVSFKAMNETDRDDIRFGLEIIDNEVGKDVLVDSVPTEMVQVPPGTLTQLTVRYPIPPWLDGSYEVFVVARGTDGAQLARSKVDTITFLGENALLGIVYGSCTYQTHGGATEQAIDTIETDRTLPLILSCVIMNRTNEPIVAQARTATHRGSLFGEQTKTAPDNDSFVLAPNSLTPVSFTIPYPSENGTYVTRLAIGDGDIASNDIVVRYHLSGLAPTVVVDGTLEPKTKNYLSVVILGTAVLLIVLATSVYYWERRKEKLTVPTQTFTE